MSIELKNINYTYAPQTAYEKHAMKNININIPQGEFLGIIGHTGSGKSTLIQHLNGLEKATSGSMYFNGEDVYKDNYNWKNLRSQVGVVFQYPEHQLFEESIIKDVAFGPLNQGCTPEEAHKKAQKALELVGIKKELYEKSPFDLSGGQMRRVAIAGVLAMEPKVLVLDEPTAGLDPQGRDEILDKISELHKNSNMTVILVSHSMEDVSKYVDKLLVMNQGEIMFYNTPQKVFTNYKELEMMGLAAPQLTYIIEKLNEKGLNIDPHIRTIEDAVNEIVKHYQS